MPCVYPIEFTNIVKVWILSVSICICLHIQICIDLLYNRSSLYMFTLLTYQIAIKRTYTKQIDTQQQYHKFFQVNYHYDKWLGLEASIFLRFSQQNNLVFYFEIVIKWAMFCLLLTTKAHTHMMLIYHRRDIKLYQVLLLVICTYSCACMHTSYSQPPSNPNQSDPKRISFLSQVKIN